MSRRPLAASWTMKGAIELRGRLPGATTLATVRLPSTGVKLKSVSWLLSMKPRTMTKLPKITSIVVVTFGGWDWPRRALEAVRDHTEVAYETVVVDNDPVDDTLEVLDLGNVDVATLHRGEVSAAYRLAAQNFGTAGAD